MKSLSTHISESFVINEDAKDDQRINDIVKKAAGNQAKADQLATNMAKAITDKSKALRRFEAAEKILGTTNSITVIFGQRAQALGNNVKVSAPSTVSMPGEASVKPLFVYNESAAKPIVEEWLNIVGKLRGFNWGTSFDNKLAKFTPEQYLLLYGYLMAHKSAFGSNGPYIYSHKKIVTALSTTLRKAQWKLKNLEAVFDLGDAKTNPSNPIHGIYETERQDDKLNADYEALKAECQSAYSEYKAPHYLFEPGETYISYSDQRKNTGKIEFFNPWAMYFWNENMIGQMSDGYWENSRKYDGIWRYFVKMTPTFNPSATKQDTSGYEMPNPKLVQKYAIQSDGEWETMGKVVTMNNSKLLKLIEYGRSYSMKTIGSVDKAFEMANKHGVEPELFLAFLFAPAASKAACSKIVSQAHSDMTSAMSTKI